MDLLDSLRKCLYYISFPLTFMGFMLPIYASDMGADAVEIGFLYSIFSFFSVLIRPKIGVLLDKNGRKIGILIGIFLYCIVNFLFLIGQGYKDLFIARVFQSIAASFLWISADTIVSDVSNTGNRSENFGIISQTISKGGFIGSIIGFIVLLSNYFQNPFKVIFFIYLIFGFLSFYNGLTKIKETVHLKKNFNIKEKLDKNKVNKFIMLIGFISYVFSLTSPLYIIYVKENITNEIYLLTCLFLPGYIFSLFLPKKFGILADRYDRGKMVVLGIFILGLFQFFIPLIKNYIGFTITYTLMSLTFMLIGPAESGLVMDYIGETKRGRSYGLYSFASGIGGILGPLVGTYFYQYIDQKLIFILAGILLLFSCMMMKFLLSIKIIGNTNI